MSDKTIVYSLSMALSASGISDKDLLYIADALFLFEQPGDPEAKRAFQRHKPQQYKAAQLEQACRARNIDSATGTKVVTSTIDLLA